jgi:hypothetical protein
VRGRTLYVRCRPVDARRVAAGQEAARTRALSGRNLHGDYTGRFRFVDSGFDSAQLLDQIGSGGPLLNWKSMKTKDIRIR